MTDTLPRRADRRPVREDRPRRSAVVALLVVFLLIVGAVVAVGRYYAWCKGAGAVRQPVRFTVADGASGDSVVAALHDRGVIRCGGLVGNLLLHGSGKASSIRAGSSQASAMRRELGFLSSAS